MKKNNNNVWSTFSNYAAVTACNTHFVSVFKVLHTETSHFHSSTRSKKSLLWCDSHREWHEKRLTDNGKTATGWNWYKSHTEQTVCILLIRQLYLHLGFIYSSLIIDSVTLNNFSSMWHARTEPLKMMQSYLVEMNECDDVLWTDVK